MDQLALIRLGAKARYAQLLNELRELETQFPELKNGGEPRPQAPVLKRGAVQRLILQALAEAKRSLNSDDLLEYVTARGWTTKSPDAKGVLTQSIIKLRLAKRIAYDKQGTGSNLNTYKITEKGLQELK